MKNEEMLAVLDPQSWKPVRTAPRSEVHQCGLLHGTVRVWWLDDENRAWFQRRSMSKSLWPGRYDPFATGHISAGESAREAALRETLEETGVDIRDPGTRTSIYFSFLRPDGIRDNEIASVFVLMPGNAPAPIRSEEVDRWAAVDLEAYADMIRTGKPCGADLYAFGADGALVPDGHAELRRDDFCVPDQEELRAVLGTVRARGK